MKFNFNKMTKGEIAFRLDEVVRHLNRETPEFEGVWLVNYDDDDRTVAEAKATWDSVLEEDPLWKDLLSAFRYMVEAYGCEDGRCLLDNYRDGLYYDNLKNAEYEEDEVGGGFFVSSDDASDVKSRNKTIRIRETLEAMGYPLTKTENGRFGDSFCIDWRKVRAKRAADWIRGSIDWLVRTECGCCTIRLTRNTQLAVGWTEGYDPDEPSVIHSKEDPSWVISIEIKALDGDDMKTDLDWLTSPYIAEGEDEGTVFELSVTPSENDDYERDFEYLVSTYSNVLKSYTVLSDGRAYRRK